MDKTERWGRDLKRRMVRESQTRVGPDRKKTQLSGARGALRKVLRQVKQTSTGREIADRKEETEKKARD